MMESLKTTITTILISAAFGLLLYGALAMAAPTGVNDITVEGSERGNITNDPSLNPVQAQAGNVTELTMDATTITKAWQGYYGNITGSLTLQDSSGNVFYNWSGLGSIAGEVYASRNDSVQWSTINCTNSSEIVTENSFLGKDALDPDSIDNTFSSNSHPELLVGDVNLGTNICNSTNAYTDSGSSATDYYQVLLADGNANVVYSTIIDEGTTGFNSNGYDFQLLVGENGNATNTGSTTYYFYIELS